MTSSHRFPMSQPSSVPGKRFSYRHRFYTSGRDGRLERHFLIENRALLFSVSVIGISCAIRR